MDIKFNLLETITNNFSEHQKVGSGGYGAVYKGMYNGKAIAVKRFYNLQGLDDTLFDSELRNLIKVEHKNVVPLLGYCNESRKIYIQRDGELIMAKINERILCFEYMEGGSLDKYIEDDYCGLDWHTCYQIIKGTCDGLNHLHGAHERPIFHLELKPSNILLDKNNMTAKIADLGLSRLVASTGTHKTQIVNIKGTLGYMPPEYIERGYISKRYDVFSLGVIILKIMAGNMGHWRLSEMSPEQFTNDVIENWEARLQATSRYLSHEKEVQQVRTCIKIAVKCVEKDRCKRPLIKDIVQELEELEARTKEMLLHSDLSTDLIGQTSYNSSILTVDPTTELRFLFEPRKDISTSLLLTNQTDGFVQFRVKTNLVKYCTNPTKGILPPCSKCYIYVTLRAQGEAPPNMECNDTFLVQSAHVSEDFKFTSDEIIDDPLKEGMVVNMIKVLPIVYVEAAKFPLYSDHSKDVIGQSGFKPPLSSGFKPALPSGFEPTLPSGSKPPLALQYLKDITNNFCDDQILGKGGFGVVYKGMLQDGEMIAVKKIFQAIPSSQKQFENEVNLLMNLEHQNIVRLVGYCYETRQVPTTYEGKSVLAWNIESLLCLEYMRNGSLHKYITDASCGLIWDARYKVIEGISYGLLYLHEHSNEPIIHLDLKPDNILLDENMRPKITDFGLSRLFAQNQTIHTIHASGTFGYMSQEVLKGVITPMADIFSLGVIILEVITGHRDYPDDIRKDSKGFIELELQRWRNRIQKEPGNTSFETDSQQIERCIQIGLICVNTNRNKRPTIKKIIDILEGTESMNWYISNELSEP